MEFDHVGGRCSVRDCGVHDFLPVRCDACKGVFCTEHFGYTEHECKAGLLKRSTQANATTTCSECGELVVLRKNEDPDAEFARHIAQVCGRKTRNRMCEHEKCKVREVIPIECKTCQKTFCLPHRNELDHECTNARAQRNIKREVKQMSHWEMLQQLRKPHMRASSSTSQNARSSNIAKQAGPSSRRVTEPTKTNSRTPALGDEKLLPPERMKLRVASPLLTSTAPIHMFFNRKFTVGRMLDEAVELGQWKFKDVRLYAFRYVAGAEAKPLSRIDRLTECLKPNELIIIDAAESMDAEFYNSLNGSNDAIDSVSAKLIRVLS
eukprot:Plantae.Rhodophyta-Purpureofilum_apyrenoidigerum.ctg22341.p1 GENE.Plantae.Rhodophyta-Purpureofilum_apyrenoidigerum.ctg22341~~Plantae.Rhodophyta-Purpureofilum_apyrenoidigerum.ctg22341.p1  ORF type:complete len:341 (+),score=40.94 Plantae.Rhodophyta-Purpureofilum_apyrenoidigerum.ctg22341:58-1023(+)